MLLNLMLFLTIIFQTLIPQSAKCDWMVLCVCVYASVSGVAFFYTLKINYVSVYKVQIPCTEAGFDGDYFSRRPSF